MQKILIGIAALLLLGFGTYLALKSGGAPKVFTEDIVLDASVVPDTFVLEKGAKLTINGDLTGDKKISCANGPLMLTVHGNATLDGSLTCEGKDSSQAGEIMLVVSGNISFGKEAKVVSDGHVQIVRDAANLLTSDEAIEKAYEEAALPTGTGPRFGPFVDEENVAVVPVSSELTSIYIERKSWLAKTAHAQAAEGNPALDKGGNVIPDAVISGEWIVGAGGPPPAGVAIGTPSKKIKKIILNFNFGANGNVQIKDFHLVGPAGRDGASDGGKSCNAKGEDGEPAMRFRVHAKNIIINNFRVELGNGGAGGTAETTRDCDPGIAKGGKGGEAGNMKMTAEEGIVIKSMNIVPGAGGNGGGATAYGKDGVPACPGTKGGDATATGGKGGKNKKELSAVGAVSGIENITISEVLGGFGGGALAQPGKGGDGTGCNCKGGMGGKATATGGDGGDASVKTGGAVTVMGATGGDGGDADATGGKGGNGGNCPLKPKGGDGGKGGDAKSKEGKGGKGDPTDGTPGEVKTEKGGDGGNGGDGCGPGAGGKGGAGREPGKDGKPGILECPVDEKKSSTVVPGPKVDVKTETGGGKAGTPTSGGTGATPTTGTGSGGTPTEGGQIYEQIKVIQYQGKYLPVDQLIVENEAGCGADHWHAAHGIVLATDGSQVFDPGPQCGFGKVKDLPVLSVPAGR